MKHQQIDRAQGFDIVDVARIWPNGADLAPGILTEVEAEVARPATAVPDMPTAAGGLVIGAYASLMMAFALTMAVGGRASFAIVISAFYVAMFFAIPTIFLGAEGDRTRRPTLAEFLDRGIDTASGRLSGAGALVQMLIVPVLLAFAILAMGITFLLT